MVGLRMSVDSNFRDERTCREPVDFYPYNSFRWVLSMIIQLYFNKRTVYLPQLFITKGMRKISKVLKLSKHNQPVSIPGSYSERSPVGNKFVFKEDVK